MLDMTITGGDVVDGTGAPRRRADVGLRDGRVVAIGEVAEDAHETIDASGRVVAPGFIDIHTHFDAQVFWDPALTPAPLHGVTTVVGGNCGFSIAPLRPEAGDYLMRMLARVEGMPLESLQKGVPWDWSSFDDYLSRLEGRVGINAGFLVGHSALRRCVMGERSVGKEATEAELNSMRELLADSLAQGGLGFSSSWAQTHNDGDGQPVPSRHATRDELVSLAGVLRDHPGTTLEFIPTVGRFSEEHQALMTDMSRQADRPLNWNVLGVTAQGRLFEEQLAASDYAAARGGRVVALTLAQVMTLRLNLISGFVFDALPGWAEVIALPLEQRRDAFADPAVRRRLDAGAQSDEAGVLRALTAWEHMTIDQGFTPETRRHMGRTVGEIAAEEGKSPFDTFCDLALADDLRTSFMPRTFGDDDESWRLRAEVWRDPRTVIGASDAGAHLDMIDTFTSSTALLGPAVRERGLLGLEEAVHHITQVPAQLYGIRDRGCLEVGAHADIVVFDPERVGPRDVHTRNDLPGGAARLYAEADGIEYVLVNGSAIVRDGGLTEALPGAVLRSGRDTETVSVA